MPKRPKFSASFYALLPPAPADNSDPAAVRSYLGALVIAYNVDTERVRARTTDPEKYHKRMPATERRDLLRLMTRWRERAEGRDVRWNNGGTTRGGRLKSTIEQDINRAKDEADPTWREDQS